FEHPPSSSGVEVSRLALVAISKIDGILRTDRHIDLFLGVSVEVAEPHRESPVGIPLPSIECGTHILSFGILNSGEREQGLLSVQSEKAGGEQQKKRCATQHVFSHYR